MTDSDGELYAKASRQTNPKEYDLLKEHARLIAKGWWQAPDGTYRKGK